MGRYITCSCGQRNDIEAFQFEEARQCLACGKLLPREADYYKAEEFAPVATDFSSGPGGHSGTANAFESPTSLTEEPPAPPPTERAWEGRVREVAPAAAVEGVRCARCNRTFRGAWDQHARPDGFVCHICASQAEKDYKVPDDGRRRELYRPAPPRKIQHAPDPEAGKATQKKRQEIIRISVVAVLALVAVNIFPVEDWMATIFRADASKAPELPVVWHWVSKAVGVGVTFLGQGIILYAALKWTNLLYDGGLGENWPTLAYLAVVISLMDEFIGGNIITFIIKLLMISERFPLRIDNGISFLLTWSLCGVLLWPCNFAIHQVLQGIVSAIALAL